MKTIFVGVKVKYEPDYDKIVKEINSLNENNFAICFSNQFVNVADKISKMINKKITSKMQILGCSNPKFPKNTEAVLIVGQGDFHPVSLAYETKLPTYILESSTLRKIAAEEVLKMEKRERGALLKYLNSEKIGILITTKPGQNRLKKAIEFKKNLKNKRGYLFIDNKIDINQFENFGMDFWVNTACPRMDLVEGPVINLEKVQRSI